MAQPTSSGPTVEVVKITRLPGAWLALSLFMVAIGFVLFVLAMLNFPLTLLASAARQSLIVHNTPDGIAAFARPPTATATLYVWNYTSVTGSSIRLQQLSYRLTLQPVRYNISFSDGDSVVRYWTRNEWQVDADVADAFRNDVIVQPSFMHFTRLTMSRTTTIAHVLIQMQNGTSGVPAMSELTSRCSISSVDYSAFVATFQTADRIIDFFQGVDRRDFSGLATRFADSGITAENIPFVASFLHSLSLIGYQQTGPGTSEISVSTPVKVLNMFMPNKTTDAAAYKPNDYTEKYTGSDDIRQLKRYRRYAGSATVQSPIWASTEQIDGARDYQADTFLEFFNVQLNMFSPITMRTETWRNLGAVSLYGLTLNHFERLPQTYQNAPTYAPNAKYYMYGPSGVWNMNPSTTGAPVHVSQPHFLGGDSALFTSLAGLAPDPALHTTFLDFEPNLGVAVRAQNRFQMNVRLEKGQTTNPLLVRGDSAYLPLFWIEIGGSADQATAQKMQSQLVGAVQACFAIRLLMSMAALPLFCYGLGILRASITYMQKN